MISYHGKEEVKAKYVARMREHQEADRLVQGYGYWSDGKGCAVGCTLEQNTDPHEQYPIELGLPQWLAHLEDHLFEALPKEEAKSFPLDFLEAIPVGVEESQFNRLRDRFQIFWLERQKTQIDCGKFHDVEEAIDGVLALLKQDIDGNDPNSAANSAAWSAARSAAESAAESAANSAADLAARSAAESAANSAARSAAESAARSAAESAAWSAADLAAWSAAESEAEVKRDWLLPELKRLKVEEFRG